MKILNTVMDFSDEWKSSWSISSVFTPPLLLRSDAGPLKFSPIPKTITLLLISPSLVPPSLFPPPPRLSLSRFLVTSSSSFLPSSFSSSLSHHFSPEDHKLNASSNFLNNRLQLLHCPSNNTILVFFPTGENSDQVGFVELLVTDSNLSVSGDKDSDDVYTSKNKFHHRIVKILVNPLDNVTQDTSTTVGYLLVCTSYSVHWFSVEINGTHSQRETPTLVYLYGKVFKSYAVVNACWNPHLPEESIILLESGELFLFNLDSCLKNCSLNRKLKGTKLRVSFDDLDSPKRLKWLGCHFSWHPRILIIACSNTVFLVDWRYGECKVRCLANIELLGRHGMAGKNRFVAFSKAGSDGYYFALACNHHLFLFDIRKPLMPVLQWDHDLEDPCYMDVFRLSELRSQSMDVKYNWATESGFCIIMGSFWNCEFSVFCYGPSSPAQRGSFSSKISKFCTTLYAWELPSELSLSGCECRCGSCHVREDFWKDALPEWIDWQQKKEIILGFGILSRTIPTRLPEQDNFGGFTLIRLMSSGKLESQRYCALWDYAAELEEAHKDSYVCGENNILLYMEDDVYKFPKIFKYLKLDYLHAYLKDDLVTFLRSNIIKPLNGPLENDSFTANFHEILVEKLKSCGIIPGLSPAVIDVLNSIGLPTSIHELAVSRMWAGLPVDLLQLAFSSYFELLKVLVDKKKVSLEFLVVPDQPQLPPFFLRKPSGRSNKWSHKVQRRNDLVGPVLPLPILHSLCDIRNSGSLNLVDSTQYPFETELTLHCNEVKQAVSEGVILNSGSDSQNGDAVSLADDREEPWNGFKKSKPVCVYTQAAYRESIGDVSDEKDERFYTFISKLRDDNPKDNMESVTLELFDDLCPVELKFDAKAMQFGPEESKWYKELKGEFSKWQKGFNLYQDFCTQLTKTR